MFHKFLKVPKFGPFPGRDTTDPVKRPAVRLHKPEERSPSVVRIVHPGAKVEVYFMAIPAYRIMEKYPYHFVTRPEVFRRPWDAVVKPDEILALGRKYYVVPRQTVKKLQRRILKPRIVSRNDADLMMKSYVSRSSKEVSTDSKNKTYTDLTDTGDKSGGFSAGRWKMAKKGIDDDSLGRSSQETKKSYEDEDKRHKHGTHGKRKTKIHALTWQPSLASIAETHE